MSVRIAVVGLGYMGAMHLEKALTIEGVEVIALIDKDSAKLKKIRERFSIKSFEDYREVDAHIDGVIVATPASTHYEITKHYLERGISVFVEKPLALTYKEAEELSNIAERKGLLLQVGFLERYNPALQEGLQFIESPLYVEAKRLSPYVGRALDVNVVFDLMIHDLDVLSCIKKDEVTSITAKGIHFMSTTVDESFAMLQFADGASGLFLASRISFERERSLRVVDKKNMVKVDFLNMKLIVAARNGQGFNIHTRDCERKDLIKEELKDFILSLKGEKEPLVKGRDTLRTIFLAEKIIDSFDKR